MKRLNLLLFALLLSFMSVQVYAKDSVQHPSLVLTQNTVQQLREGYQKYPLMHQAIDAMKQRVDAAMQKDMCIPIPKDPGGGFTHEQHKRNYMSMYEAGVLYQVFQDAKYAKYVETMLLKYADMFPSLPTHPVKKSYAPGKLFWQCLNDDNWVVYSTQAYDCVYETLSAKTIKKIEKNLWRPYAKFLSVQNLPVFNRVHNHGAWDVAAVGMIGYVIGDHKIVDQCLYGYFKKPLKGDDNYREQHARAGFYANLNQLFSPTGYYTEGPYYQRYSMTPFITFAEVIQNNEPKRDIFHYRNNVLLNAVDGLIQLTDAKGQFLPYNDAIKEMSIQAPVVVDAIGMAYGHYQNPNYLAVAHLQNKVGVSAGGLMLAKAIAEGKAPSMVARKSTVLTDGNNGKEGGIAFMYSNNPKNQTTMTMKFSKHGLAHGHFDKLSILFYDNDREVLQDYGAARYVNVEAKDGGRYLAENKTFARQTGSHSTMTVDGKCQFDANFDESMKRWGDLLFFDTDHKEYQGMRADQKQVYKGVDMQRTIVQIQDASLNKPFFVDVMEGFSKEEHSYDLAYHYLGQVMDYSFDTFNSEKTLSPLGTEGGFQYIWKVATAETHTKNAQFSWLNDKTFYSITTANTAPTQEFMGLYGANDPHFNLRNQPMYMMRRKGKDVRFVNIFEPHGSIHPATDELVNNTKSQIKNVTDKQLSNGLTQITVDHANGHQYIVLLSNNNDKTAAHQATVNGQDVKWEGPLNVIIK
ncbi:alginate lyase family protein [Persicobacter psychrovividus]|uniref:Alginate lyase n=1 Tax=Persicobacter psychrovividus TaxID=387638 RepID=A0ABM7VJ15_9BACT|nr:hypothetical protein PEPS_32240 [Persicobacter psychrovividus]